MILYVISSTKVEADWQATSKLFILRNPGKL